MVVDSRLRLAFPRGSVLVGVLSAVVLVGLAGVSIQRVRDGENELLALPVAASLVKETYSEDEAVGERIIEKMQGRVHNPMWTQLMGSTKMRRALAAAIGAERLQPGGSGASAFDLGNLLSGMTHQKRDQVKQELRLASYSHQRSRISENSPEPISPRREWELARARSHQRRGEQTFRRGEQNFQRRKLRRRAARRGSRSSSWGLPEMPDRLAENGWQQALLRSATRKKLREAPVYSSAAPRHASHKTKYVFDEFAPGVLPGTQPPVQPGTQPPAAAVHVVPLAHKPSKLASLLAKKASKAPLSVKDGLQKATGFGDTLVKVAPSAEDKLKQEVQHLKLMNAHERAQFEHHEKVDIEKRLMALEQQQFAAAATHITAVTNRSTSAPLKLMSAHAREQFEHHEQADIEKHLMALEHQQLPGAAPDAAAAKQAQRAARRAAVGFSLSPQDAKARGILKQAKGSLRPHTLAA